MRQIITTYRNKISHKLFGIVNLRTKSQKRGVALLSYLTAPFIQAPGKKPSDPHTNYWECAEIARLLQKRGFDVDVINASNTTFIPRKKYDVIIDTHQNLERLHTLLPKHCVKIMHVTFAYPEFQNRAEEKRLESLFIRRGLRLPPHRFVAPSENAKYADYLVGFTSETIEKSYKKFGKDIFPIPISVSETYEFPNKKDFEITRSHFLWFGGGGAVHKGLDLVIEAFIKMPHLKLSLIGPAVWEKEFEKVYEKELTSPNIKRYHRPQIGTDGVIRVDDRKLIDIFNECATVIFPSACESASGSVIQAMHGALIPIVTKEASLSPEAPSIFIEEATPEGIKKAVEKFLALPVVDVRKMAEESWNFARRNHTKETFSEAYNNFLNKILYE